MTVDIEEPESLPGPEDLDVLRQILRYASRKDREIFTPKEQSEHLAATRVRWDEHQRVMVTQEERARRNVQEVDDEFDHNWTAACEGLQRKW